LYGYSNILLLTYIEVAQTENLNLLIISGDATKKELSDRWNEIVIRNAQVNGVGIDDYEENLKTYAGLLADYETVRLSLLECMFVIDEDTLLYLASKGYRLDTSSASKYAESIQNCLQKSKNILTKLKTKFKQIQESSKDNQERVSSKTTIEEILANISVALGFSVDPHVTLARFNEYKKIVKKRSENNKHKRVA